MYTSKPNLILPVQDTLALLPMLTGATPASVLPSLDGLLPGMGTDDDTPSLIVSNLRGNFDARYGLYQDTGGITPATGDGDPVGLCQDQSGNGFHISQGSASLKATLRLNAINGLPALQFLSGDYLATSVAASSLVANNAYTIYVVGKVTAVGSNTTTPGSYYTNDSFLAFGGGYGGIILTSGTPNAHLYNYDGNEDVITKALTLATWIPFYAQHSGGNIYFGFGNGTEVTAPSGNTSVISNPLVVGTGIGGAADKLIARVLVYNVAHSAAEKAQTMAYLNSVYGVSL